ncbi:MAG: hypothetical protein FJ316_06600 [SAR202 cluster bacterium]|nr:hypothetical protein [SAR202 cluster bacterium]
MTTPPMSRIPSPPPDQLTVGAPPPDELDGESPAWEGAGLASLLRELRAEVQDLQKVLELVASGQTTMASYAPYVTKTMRDLAGLVGQIHDGGGDHSDTIRHLHNLYKQMKDNPLLKDPATELSAQEQLHQLNILNGLCREVMLWVGYLTIPERLNSWLAGARPGYYIPFHDVFANEVPNFDDRVAILNSLAWSPEVVQGGLVDADSGLIYKYSQSPARRLVSFLLLAVAGGIAVAVVAGAAYLRVPSWPLSPSHLSALLIGWGAVLAGVVVHVGIGTAKRMQSQRGRPPVLSPGDLPLLVNAKVGQLLLKLLLTLVGFFGLVFAAGVEQVTPMNAFLVGYALDSVVELFSSSLELRASARVAALKEQLGR